VKKLVTENCRCSLKGKSCFRYLELWGLWNVEECVVLATTGKIEKSLKSFVGANSWRTCNSELEVASNKLKVRKKLF
jgi:hypothetical protein